MLGEDGEEVEEDEEEDEDGSVAEAAEDGSVAAGGKAKVPCAPSAPHTYGRGGLARGMLSRWLPVARLAMLSAAFSSHPPSPPARRRRPRRRRPTARPRCLRALCTPHAAEAGWRGRGALSIGCLWLARRCSAPPSPSHPPPSCVDRPVRTATSAGGRRAQEEDRQDPRRLCGRRPRRPRLRVHQPRLRRGESCPSPLWPPPPSPP